MDPLAQRIDHLLRTQLQGVLATQYHTEPYTSLMAFAHTADLRYLLLATYKESRKHANLLLNAQVSVLIDNRTNTAADYTAAVAISVCGLAAAIPAEERAELQACYLEKHPQLQTFVSSEDCALLRIEVSCYRVISQFQALEIWTPQ
jgi:heme iron utilization protein